VQSLGHEPSGLRPVLILSWALMGQVRTLSAERIGKKLGLLNIEELEQIIEGLNEIIGT
jgi:mRNA interferase MazF